MAVSAEIATVGCAQRDFRPRFRRLSEKTGPWIAVSTALVSQDEYMVQPGDPLPLTALQAGKRSNDPVL